MSPCVMSLPLLCPEILRNRFAQYKALSLSLITFGPKHGIVNKKSGMSFHSDTISILIREEGSILYKMSFRDHEALQWV